MRLWHKSLVKYLPDMQLRGQWRECVLIAKDLNEKGKTNHLLINILQDYTYDEFATYCWIVLNELDNRGINVTAASVRKIFNKQYNLNCGDLFVGWHDKEYLRVCVCNLFEKYKFGRGKSRVSQEEWDKILQGYKKITGEDWVL